MKHAIMKPATKGKVGALVTDGGQGEFPADIIEIGDVFVIVANPGLGGITFSPFCENATHEFVNGPKRCYENPERGFFVVPKGQLFGIED